MEKQIDLEFEKAIRFLVKYLPESEKGARKPVLPHAVRVGVYLYEKNYSRDVIIAGLLHDALEWSKVTEELLRQEFGENVLKIVKACTKDRTIENSDERIDELVKRCVEAGKDALVIKAADTIDSFKYYSKVNNESELDYCRKNTEAVFRYKNDFEDEVFGKLGKWLKN